MSHDPPRILVVDDDVDICRNLSDILSDLGYRVDSARDGREAAGQLKDTPYKVVLIDMRIPDGNGSDVFQMVREGNPQARTILITGHRSEMDQLIDQMVAEGADAVCYKPFDVPALLAKVGELAAAHEEEAGPPAQ